VSRKRLFLLAAALALAAVGAAWALTEASGSFLVPVLPYVEGSAALLFLVGPGLATIAFGLGSRHSFARSVGAGAFSTALAFAVSWVTWIGGIVVYCGFLGHACFD
jgi:hypothetical protein